MFHIKNKYDIRLYFITASYSLIYKTSIRIILICTTLFTSHILYATEISNTETAGDVLQILIPAVGLGAAIFYEEGNEGVIQFSKSMATTVLITGVLKKTVDKTRPNGNCCESFPSGHTSAAFSGASFIHKRYGWEYSVPAYVGASYVAYSRVHANKHYVEDVIAGAAIGILSTFYFTTSYRNTEITPFSYNGGWGINFSAKW